MQQKDFKKKTNKMWKKVEDIKIKVPEVKI